MVQNNYAGRQVTQWDFQNKGKSGWTGTSSFVSEVPLCNLPPSIIYSVQCDRMVQRAYSTKTYQKCAFKVQFASLDAGWSLFSVF